MNNNTETYNQLLNKWTRYIEKIANSWSNKDDDLAKDLKQEGRIALLTLDYKEDKGDEETYVKMMIRHSMKKYLTNNLRTIRIPAHIQHSTKYQGDANIFSTISLNTTINDDGNVLEDLIADKSEDTSEDDTQINFKLRYKNAIETLKPQWQYILLNYYGYNENEAPMTLQELGDELGISKEAVRQQLDKAKEKVREIMIK